MMQTRFGASAPYTVGVEEELQLVDPASLELIPAIDAVLAAREAAGGCPKARLPPSSPPPAWRCAHPPTDGGRAGAGALYYAAGSRTSSRGAGAPRTGGIAPVLRGYRAGDHRQGTLPQVDHEMGWPARMQAIYGLHIHVAVPDEEHADPERLSTLRHVPLFVALSANSRSGPGPIPARLGAHEGLGLMPRTGLPPRLPRLGGLRELRGGSSAAGNITDYTLCWWDPRPHPRLGTVELRAPDTQTEPWRIASLAAPAQCLVATADEQPPENPLLTAENKRRAARYGGLAASFHDFSTGRSVPALEAVRDLVSRLRPVSQDLGCEPQLEGLLEMTRAESGAEKQRSVHERRHSIKDVVEHLVANL